MIEGAAGRSASAGTCVAGLLGRDELPGQQRFTAIPASIAARRYAAGSMPFSFAVSRIEYSVAATSVPRSDFEP